jgi:Flp pilus assembly pilin Flp
MALMRAARVLCAAAAGALLYAVLDSRLGTAGDLEIFLAAARAERPYDAGSVLAAMKAGGRVVRWVEEWAGRGCSPFFYPPGIWHAMRPMGRMDRGAAFLLLALLNAGAMAAMAVRAPAAARRDFVILALPTLAMNIALGQVNLILAAMADAGLAGLAASCKPFALAGARPGRRIREAALLAGLLAAQWAAFGDLFREWLSNLPCLERLGDPGGAVGAWQAGVRALLPLPVPARPLRLGRGASRRRPPGAGRGGLPVSRLLDPIRRVFPAAPAGAAEGRGLAGPPGRLDADGGRRPALPAARHGRRRAAGPLDGFGALWHKEEERRLRGDRPDQAPFFISSLKEAAMAELKRLILDERGDITQNAVFLAIIIILTIAALRLLGGNVRDLFNRIAGYVANP